MSFVAWFEDNKERIEPLLRGDAEEALYEAYNAGMEHMSKFMADTFARSPAEPYVDRMGGQFTREETERNWDGWR
jgi:hypothetical protein